MCEPSKDEIAIRWNKVIADAEQAAAAGASIVAILQAVEGLISVFKGATS